MTLVELIELLSPSLEANDGRMNYLLTHSWVPANQGQSIYCKDPTIAGLQSLLSSKDLPKIFDEFFTNMKRSKQYLLIRLSLRLNFRVSWRIISNGEIKTTKVRGYL
jgi:hypothetical protein